MLFLRLPRRCNEGEQDGDDGFLDHIHFVFYCNAYLRAMAS